MLSENTASTNQQTEAQSMEEQQKKDMLAIMQSESQKFQQALADYNALKTPNKMAYLKVNSDLVQSVDKIIAAGDWQKTLFLRNTIKPLLEVREKALVVQTELTQEDIAATVQKELKKDHVKVFMTIYQSKGHNLALWEAQLRSLSSYVQGRPIYANEDDIRRALRAKLDQVNEAYVVVAVNSSSIMQGSSHGKRIDRYGHKLLTLMPGAMRIENIFEFVHQDKRYAVIDNKLILK